MKKILCFLLIFSLSIGSFCFQGSASYAATSDETKVDAYIKSLIDGTISSPVLSEVSGGLDKKIAVSRYYYFYVIFFDKWNAGSTIFKSSTEFNEGYLRSYWIDAVNQEKTDSDGNVYLNRAGFSNVWSTKDLGYYYSKTGIPFWWNSLTNGDLTQFYKFKDDFNALLVKYRGFESDFETSDNPVASVPDLSAPTISSDDFKQLVSDLNHELSPKSTGTFMISYRHNSKYQDKLNGTEYPYFSLYNDGKFVGDVKDLYFIPFFKAEDGTMFYPRYQVKLTRGTHKEIKTVNGEEVETEYYHVQDEIISYVDGLGGTKLVEDNPHYLWKHIGIVSYGVICARLPNPGAYGFYICPSVRFYSDLSNYENLSSNGTGSTSTIASRDNVTDSFFNFFSSDYSVDFVSAIKNGLYELGEQRDGLKMKYADNPYKNTDCGFICSGSEIKMQYDIDTNKIPDNSTITITGDTAYNYTITDNTTGDTTTINQYITYDYHYPPSPAVSGSGGNGGGTVGGDVNVGGKVDVGGNLNIGGDVGVNVSVSPIEINVNGGNGGGTGGNGNSYEMPDMNPVDSYLDDALSQSSGVRKFMTSFFGFLPAPVVLLICILLTVVILCRIFGR